jgi:photosystem II stability/assembly factor-like uncharacterized protein
MRCELILLPLVAVSALSQSAPRILTTHTAEGLRGASAVSRNIAWASGSHGTYLRTTDGLHWQSAQVPDASALDFRGVVAFTAEEAFLMSAGPGDQSRIYHTTDAGKHWQLQFTNSNPKGFFDSMVFWDRTHGVVLGDPIPDEDGKLKFELLLTEDGQTWRPIPPSRLPPAEQGEGAFAASNSCLAILNSRTANPASKAEGAPQTPDGNIWFVTGGRVARVFHSPDRGRTWQVSNTPILHGPDSAGIFSVAFRDAAHGAIAGGDYKHPKQDGPNLAFTADAGKTWDLSPLRPQAYFSAVAYDRKSTTNKERIYIVGQDFVFDFRPPRNPTRISPKKKKTATRFNALAVSPDGGALVVGPNGTIATIP